MTGLELQAAISELAHITGWRVAHFRAARTTHGWRTPGAADGAGFPDLVLVHAKRRLILWRELKTDRGRPSPEQTVWLEQLTAAGGDAGIWRVRDWPTIVTTLTGQ